MKYIVTSLIALIGFYALAFSGLMMGEDCYWYGITRFVFSLN